MSETSSAPLAVAPSAPPAQASLPLPPPLIESKPAPNTLPPITPSEAGRLLAAQRRAQLTGSPTAQSVAPANMPATPAGSVAAGLSAIEQALGMPAGGLAQQPSQAPAQQQPAQQVIPSGADTDGIVFDGRRYALAEVRQAISMANDYTQKSQANAELARQLRERHDALAAVLPHIQPELQRLGQILQNPPPRPDPALLEVDPNRYHRERAIWEQAMEDQQRLASIEQLRLQAQERAMAAAVQQATEQLKQELPFWNDEPSRLAAQRMIVDWARSKGGFSDQELKGITAAHHLKTLLKAAAFDRMVEGSRSTMPPIITVARGVAIPQAPTERLARAEQQFGQKLDWRSGAALMAARRANAANGMG